MQSRNYLVLALLFAFTFSNFTHIFSQDTCFATTVDAFYECYGGIDEFTANSQLVISSYIQAEDAIYAENYQLAKDIIDNVFSTLPKGNNVWWSIYNDVNGSNIGSPHGYYGMRMMETIADYYLTEEPPTEAPTLLKMKSVIAGCSQGIQPTSQEDIENGTGVFTVNELDERIREDNYRLIYQSSKLFREYITAITKGKLVVELEVLDLEDLCLDATVTQSANGSYFANGNTFDMFNSIDDETFDGTDFWWMVWPSAVPDYPDFEGIGFITGGVGGDSKGGPVFIIDDLFLTEKPEHLGEGAYSDIESRLYHPQWFMHEFYHHVFNLYPEFELEVNGHDWFDINFWPDDFEGQFEPDFYTEALNKRIPLACDDLSTKLITRKDGSLAEFYSQLVMEDLVGPHSLDAVQNDWHIGEIILEGDKYFWLNAAGVQWELVPNLSEGNLETKEDCPYFPAKHGIELYLDEDQNPIAAVKGLQFQGSLYRKRFNSLRSIAPLEYVLGDFTEETQAGAGDQVSLTKNDGIFYFNDSEGIVHELLYAQGAEFFTFDEGSSFFGQKIELIIFESDCGLMVTGFVWDNSIYWRSPLAIINQAPELINPMADLSFDQGDFTDIIDISEVFTDADMDLLSYLVTSDSDLLTVENNGEELMIAGSEVGVFNIILKTHDSKGGSAQDDFQIEVKSTSNTLGVDLENEVLIYPNPTSSKVVFSENVANHKLTIRGIQGKTFDIVRLESENPQMDVNHLPIGMYLLEFTDLQTGLSKYAKLVKK